ncbi:DUF3515 domain-containing protein [Streptomyces sp. NPDC002851]
MKISRRRPLLLTALGLLFVTMGCSSTDDTATIAVPSPDAETARLCKDLHKQLPQRLGGLDREDPEPRSELTAAWGGSAIILRCGVPRPAAMLDEKSDGVIVNDVRWLLEPQDDGSFRFTSGLRQAYVEVTLDKKRAEDNGLGPLTDLAKPVKKAIPEGVANPT